MPGSNGRPPIDGQVSDPKAYLARIVSNLAMERLRSTRRQRETYVGPWLPEPILTEAGCR